MTRGTTPTIVFELPETVDLSQVEHVYATLVQGSKTIQKSGDEIDVSSQSATFSLTQEETLLFSTVKPVDVQLNWVYEDGKRGCTEIVHITVRDNLEPRVLE